MDADQWPLGLDVVKQQVIASQHEQVVERKARPRPQKEHALNCPRCNSTNTKFCYYNNYSLSQPRYFCKTCRRYWTEGGTTRNVPVGGGSRKNKRSTTCTSSPPSSSPSSLMKRKLPDPTNFQNPRIRGGQLEDLSLGYGGGRNHHHHPTKNVENHVYNNSTSCGLIPMFFGEEGKSVEFDENPNNLSSSSSSSIRHFMPAGINASSIGFSFLGSTMQLTTNANNADQYFKLQSLDGQYLNHHIGYGNARTIQEGVFLQETSTTRLISHHPYEEEPSNYKPFTTSVAADHHRYELEQQNKGQLGEPSSGYWGGMLGGGSW